MYSRVLILAAILAIAIAQDISVGPPGWAVIDGQLTAVGVNIKNLNGATSLTSVAFKAVSGSPAVSVTYIGAGTQVSIGTINAGATGSGAFNVLGSVGSYYVSIYITYKKSGVNKNYNLTIPLEIQEDGSGGTGKRDEENAVALVDESIYDRDLAARDTYVNIATTEVDADAGDVTWSSIVINVGAVAVTSMTYSIVPNSPVVSIGYPYTTGNSLGSSPANSQKTASFQHMADCGYYNLNVTVSYKLSGTSTVRKIWKIVLLSVAGASCEGGDTLAKRGEFIRSDMEGANANGYNTIPVEYAFGIAVAGVALVAVFSVVGAMIVLRKRTQEITVA